MFANIELWLWLYSFGFAFFLMLWVSHGIMRFGGYLIIRNMTLHVGCSTIIILCLWDIY